MKMQLCFFVNDKARYMFFINKGMMHKGKLTNSLARAQAILFVVYNQNKQIASPHTLKFPRIILHTT